MAPLKFGFTLVCAASAGLQTGTQKADETTWTTTTSYYPARIGEPLQLIPHNGDNLARKNSTVNPNIHCPAPWGWPSPPDGSGNGPALVEMSMRGMPKKSKSCGSCGPKCKKVLDMLIPAFLAYQHGDSGYELFNTYATKNVHFTTTGFGATSHACFGHTFQGFAEVTNDCYSFGSRIGTFFWPTATDLIVSNCGDRIAAQLYCDNCTNSAGTPYPQRYTWMLHLEEAEHLVSGFQLYKLNAVLDSENTLGTAIHMKDTDPFLCNYIQNPLNPIAPMPEPNVFFPPVEGIKNPSTVCEECPKCDARYEVLERATKDAVAGNLDELMSFFADNATLDFVGAGPTKAGCFGKQYFGREEMIELDSSPLKRLQSMLESYKLIHLDTMIDSCGMKFNAFAIFDLVGKGGFRYTLHVVIAFYLDDVADKDSDDFTIGYARLVEDSEVLMNMAEREQKHDSHRCERLGPWSKSITHTNLHP